MPTRLLPLVLSAILFSASASAQEATISGAVSDDTRAALPGATISATSLETGRQLATVSDDRGEYRLHGVPPGRYKLQAELPGFSTIIIQEIELLVGTIGSRR